MTIEKPRDGYLVAHDHEEKIVYWLSRFGGLASDQLGRLVWHNAHQSQRMAQRTLQRLVTRDEVLRRPLPNGGCVYTLTESGAARVRGMGLPASARGGRDLRWSKPLHRFLTNEIAISHIAQGQTVWTEYEIKRGLAPLQNIWGLVPDLLTLGDPDDPTTLIWYEMENSIKSPLRLARLLKLAYRLTARMNGCAVKTYHLMQFVFVTPHQRSFNAVGQAIHRFFSQRESIAPRALERIQVWHTELTPRLDWRGIKQQMTAQDILDYIATQRHR